MTLKLWMEGEYLFWTFELFRAVFKLTRIYLDYSPWLSYYIIWLGTVLRPVMYNILKTVQERCILLLAWHYDRTWQKCILK